MTEINSALNDRGLKMEWISVRLELKELEAIEKNHHINKSKKGFLLILYSHIRLLNVDKF